MILRWTNHVEDHILRNIQAKLTRNIKINDLRKLKLKLGKQEREGDFHKQIISKYEMKITTNFTSKLLEESK